ncbi:hypothetical protein [Streptomyces sp. NPDC096311]|uniref:hypothetical protein n=1 Tax=Streptomyces sp. NPDC096311 TaxID=3366083 RepID=UPI00381FFFF6
MIPGGSPAKVAWAPGLLLSRSVWAAACGAATARTATAAAGTTRLRAAVRAARR